MISGVFVGILAYFAVSLLLFIFPNILWKKKTYKNRIINKALSSNKIISIAHRGGPRHRT